MDRASKIKEIEKKHILRLGLNKIKNAFIEKALRKCPRCQKH